MMLILGITFTLWVIICVWVLLLCGAAKDGRS